VHPAEICRVFFWNLDVTTSVLLPVLTPALTPALTTTAAARRSGRGRTALPTLQLPPTLVEPDLGPGNSKLGSIWNWSIPASFTCPGRSTLCEQLCYADNSFYYTSDVRNKLFSNLSIARLPVFADWMLTRIRVHRARLVRIHVAGDFFSADYIRAWGRVFLGCPSTRFYYYTRSWRVPALREALEANRFSNVRVWYSCDRETGKPDGLRRKASAGIRLAYMLTENEVKPAFRADLIFRDKSWQKGTRVKRIAGRLVCPAEQFIAQSATCERCRICYDDARAALLDSN
jgi:hypothetical protein